MKNFLSHLIHKPDRSYIVENISDCYFEIKKDSNKLLFYLKNQLSYSESYLLIKHRKTEKRILKKVIDSKVELNCDEIYEMNELGFFDIYLYVEGFEEIFLERVDFNLENDIAIDDEINLRSINFYKTKNGNLSFTYLEIIKPKIIEGDYKLTAVVLVYNGEPFLRSALTL